MVVIRRFDVRCRGRYTKVMWPLPWSLYRGSDRYRGRSIEVLCTLSWSLYIGSVVVTVVIMRRFCFRYCGHCTDVTVVVIRKFCVRYHFHCMEILCLLP